MSKLNVRLAVEGDYEAVVDVSQGIYDGLDYLPVVFHKLLTQPNRVLFVAELEGKIIGTEFIFVVDEGETAIERAWRIHPKYRGRGLGSQMARFVLEYVKQNYPRVSRVRTTIRKNARYPRRDIFQYSFKIFNVSKDFTISGEPGIPKIKLSRYSKEEFSDIILDKPVTEVLFKKHLHIVDWIPFEAERYNLDLMVNEGDCLLADQSAKDYSRGMVPKSFSHGRLSPRVECCVWVTAIYTDDPALFAAHLLKQLRVARETIEGDFVLSFSCAEKHKDHGREICEDKLGLELRQEFPLFVGEWNKADWDTN